MVKFPYQKKMPRTLWCITRFHDEDEKSRAIKRCQSCHKVFCRYHSKEHCKENIQHEVLDVKLMDDENSLYEFYMEKNVQAYKRTQFLIKLKAKYRGTDGATKAEVTIFNAKQESVPYTIDSNEDKSLFTVSYTPVKEGLHSIVIFMDGSGQSFHFKVHPGKRDNLSFEFKCKFGSKGSGDGELQEPYYVTCDKDGNIYVSDNKCSRVQIYDTNGVWTKSLFLIRTKKEKSCHPSGLALNSKNHLIVADISHDRLQEFDGNLNLVKIFGSKGSNNNRFKQPYGIALDSEDNIYVVYSGNHRLQVYDKDWNWLRTIGSWGYNDGQLNNPIDITLCKITNRIFVNDSNNGRIQVFDLYGKFLFKIAGNKDEEVSGLTVINEGKHLLLCNTTKHCIQVFDASNGTYIKSFGSKGSNDDQFNEPSGICLLPSGHIIITDASQVYMHE